MGKAFHILYFSIDKSYFATDPQFKKQRYTASWKLPFFGFHTYSPLEGIDIQYSQPGIKGGIWRGS